MVAKSDVSDSWRGHRHDGGLVMDVRSSEVICEGLSMPHSPRYYKGKLYVLNAGTGYFGWIDTTRGVFEPIIFCPGFLRGLDFVGNYALVGMSSLRKNKTFSGLALGDNLEKSNVKPRCGLQVINLETGNAEYWIRMEGIIDELYDVKIMKGVVKPLLIGTHKDEIKKMISIDE